MTERAHKQRRVACGFSAALLGAEVPACAQGSAGGASDLAPYVVSEIPDTAQRDFTDFGGKLALVAHEISPSEKASPGQSVTAKLYWKPIGVMLPGWALFTH